MPEEKPVTSAELRTALEAVVETLSAQQGRMVGTFTASQNQMAETLTGRQDRMAETLIARQDRMAETFTASLNQMAETFIARQDRAVEVIAGEISAFRTEVNAHFTEVDRRLDRMTERLDLLWTGQSSLNKWADRLDKDQTALGANYFNQQRAIEELRRRIEALEKRAS